MYHFVVPSDHVRDAAFVQVEGKLFIVIMSSLGFLYTEALNEQSACGPFFMMNVIGVNHPQSSISGGKLNGGGASVYYSPLLKLMFFSYTEGMQELL